MRRGPRVPGDARARPIRRLTPPLPPLFRSAHTNIVTVAVFAPETARRVFKPYDDGEVAAPTRAAAALVQPQPAKFGLASRIRSRHEKEAAEAQKVGEAAVAAAAAVGQVVVTSGYSGEIRIFENSGLPTWL